MNKVFKSKEDAETYKNSKSWLASHKAFNPEGTKKWHLVFDISANLHSIEKDQILLGAGL